MPGFSKNAYATPFGKNVFLRSTQDIKTNSYTVDASTVPLQTIDGWANQRVLQPGTVMAKITSGAGTGKIGPFQAAGSAAAEVQTITPTTVTAGTFTITLFPGVNGTVTTSAIAWNATTATVQAAIRAALATSSEPGVVEYADSIAVGGAATVNAGAITVTYTNDVGADVPQLTVDTTSLTGTLAVTTTTAGAVGALDGRGNTANIIGICNTFLPWQLTERDVEVAVIYEASVVQANCFEYTASGLAVALTNTTAAALVALKSLDIKFF